MKKKIAVEGMKCENCAKHVKEAVSGESIKLAINSEKYKVIEIETI